MELTFLVVDDQINMSSIVGRCYVGKVQWIKSIVMGEGPYFIQDVKGFSDKKVFEQRPKGSQGKMSHTTLVLG
jgi:hypothetical protein